MRAMVLEAQGRPLVLRELPVPRPGEGEILVAVSACGVCRTDLHVVDGDLTRPKLPLIPGHQIVGRVVELGPGVQGFTPGQRVGVPWLGGSCGRCDFCLRGRENLCEQAQYTGYQRDGGFAEYAVARAEYAFPLPADYGDLDVAPLLCAGLIGYRAWRRVRDAERLGLYGFGAAAHILIQLARHCGQRVFAFTRPGDEAAQAFARSLGAAWAGGSDIAPPESLDGAILFAPVGALVPAALRAVRKGGCVVCAGIHMSDIPAFPYEILWGERQLVSVANLTRRDGEEFLPLAAAVPIATHVQLYPLERANEALDDLRAGRFTGAAVLAVAAP
ncbi:MAG: alcohol dehydrogenase [Porticoccaceae bacterium]|nr:MAG: alcohol dehydrogenase [Porticoccaceae bacterium]